MRNSPAGYKHSDPTHLDFGRSADSSLLAKKQRGYAEGGLVDDKARQAAGLAKLKEMYNKPKNEMESYDRQIGTMGGPDMPANTRFNLLGAAYNSEGKVLAPEKGLPGIIADRNWKGADSLAQTHSLIGERQGTNIKFGSAEQGDIARTSRGIPDYANESVQPEEGPTLLEKPKKGYP